jgi:hypothetical protein
VEELDVGMFFEEEVESVAQDGVGLSAADFHEAEGALGAEGSEARQELGNGGSHCLHRTPTDPPRATVFMFLSAQSNRNKTNNPILTNKPNHANVVA